MKTERELWYSDVSAMFEAVKHLKNRELMFLKGIKVRWLHAGSFNFLKSIIKTFDVDKKDNCAYCSLDYYAHIPFFTANLSQRKKQTDLWASSNDKKIIGVDFGIDIDFKNGSWRDSLNVVDELLETVFKPSGIKFAFWCSLGHGFHFVIPYSEVKHEMPSLAPNRARDFYRLIAIELQKKFPSIDLSAYMESRVFKAPYMLGDSNEVVFPLTFKDYDNLKNGSLSLKPSWILNNVVLRNRGVFINGENGKFKRFLECIDGVNNEIN